MASSRPRIVLADDHPALVAGIRHELEAAGDLHVVGTAGNSTQLVELLSRTPCDVLVTDYVMPGGQYSDGMSLLSLLRRRFAAVNIVVFTMVENLGLTLEMQKLGIKAVVSKADDLRHLGAAVRAAGRGASYASPSVDSRAGAGRAPDVHKDGLQALSKRELEVIRLYVAGLSIQEIAEQLYRSKQTVSAQKMNAMRKIGIERDAQLFRFVYEIGFCHTP